jgi:hypothetical protein
VQTSTLSASLGHPNVKLAGLGLAVSALLAASANEVGATLTVTALAGLTFFCATVACYLAAPHVAVALTIPLFAFLPAVKALVMPTAGPVKDVVVLAAITAMAIRFLQRSESGQSQPGDRWTGVVVALLIALYVANPGGREGLLELDPAWFHGVRLVSEPLLLLLVGLSIDDPRRTLRWALTSLVATGVVVACIGVMQQVVGREGLVKLGYSYEYEVRSVGGRLRSFGPFDESFAYAAFLMFGCAAVVLWMRRGGLAYIAALAIGAGLLVSFVRGVVPVVVALIGLWLARNRNAATAVLLLGASCAAAVAFLITAETRVPRRTIQAGPSTYLTLNERTSQWQALLSDPSVWSVGWGVGAVGTAAERATFGLTRPNEARPNALNSGYLATMADVGVLGVLLVLALFVRLLVLSRRAIRQGFSAGWVALGLLTVLAIDASVRDSLTGFPTAFLALLLVGIALSAAREDAERSRSAKSTLVPARSDGVKVRPPRADQP